MNSLATPFARVKTIEIIKNDETALTGKYRQALTSQTVQQLHNQATSLLCWMQRREREIDQQTKKEQSESSTLSKTKRKSWTTLKEFVEKRTR